MKYAYIFWNLLFIRGGLCLDIPTRVSNLSYEASIPHMRLSDTWAIPRDLHSTINRRQQCPDPRGQLCSATTCCLSGTFCTGRGDCCPNIAETCGGTVCKLPGTLCCGNSLYCPAGWVCHNEANTCCPGSDWVKCPKGCMLSYPDTKTMDPRRNSLTLLALRLPQGNHLLKQ